MYYNCRYNKREEESSITRYLLTVKIDTTYSGIIYNYRDKKFGKPWIYDQGKVVCVKDRYISNRENVKNFDCQ